MSVGREEGDGGFLRRDRQIFRSSPNSKFVERGSETASRCVDVDIRLRVLIVVGEGLVEFRRRRLIKHIKGVQVRGVNPALRYAGVDLPRWRDMTMVGH